MHLKYFDCIDSKGSSKLLVTTRIQGRSYEVLLLSVVEHVGRIKGVLDRGGKEVQLALLGLQESVALLQTVAQLDSVEVPPQLLEIAGKMVLDDSPTFDMLCSVDWHDSIRFSALWTASGNKYTTGAICIFVPHYFSLPFRSCV